MGGERDDLVHIVTAAGLIGRSDDSELRHVALEPVGLLDGQRSPRHTVALRLDDDWSSMSVTLRHTSTSHPASRSTRAATSAHTNVAACPTWVVSYGVMPHTYTRALPRTGSGVSPMRSEGAEPSAAWEVIVFAAVVEPAGDTVGVGSDDNSRHDTPVSRPWAIPSSFLWPPRLRISRVIEQSRWSSSAPTSRGRPPNLIAELCSERQEQALHAARGNFAEPATRGLEGLHALSAVLNRKIPGHSRATRRELSVVRSDTSASRGRQPGSRACAPQGSGGMRPSAARRRMRASNMSAVSTQSAKPAWRAAIVLLTNGERPVSAITMSA